MPKNTDAHIEKRLMILDSHIQDLDFKGKSYSGQDLLDYLKTKNFIISQPTLSRDLEELASNNKFVENIGMYYSKYMENIAKTYDRIEREAWKIYNKKWTQSKTIKKEALTKTENIKNLTETVTTKEIAGPKLGALKLIADIEKQRQELASGKNLELSAAMWIKKSKEYEEQIKELKSKIPKEEIVKISN